MNGKPSSKRSALADRNPREKEKSKAAPTASVAHPLANRGVVKEVHHSNGTADAKAVVKADGMAAKATAAGGAGASPDGGEDEMPDVRDWGLGGGDLRPARFRRQVAGVFLEGVPSSPLCDVEREGGGLVPSGAARRPTGHRDGGRPRVQRGAKGPLPDAGEGFRREDDWTPPPPSPRVGLMKSYLVPGTCLVNAAPPMRPSIPSPRLRALEEGRGGGQPLPPL